MIILVNAPQAFAHTHRVLTINGQQVEFVVGWVVEPPYVDEVNAVDFWAHYINASCPQGTVSTSCPVYGLDQTLQVQVITGGQSQTLTFSPNLSNDVPPLFYGEYTANIEPTVAGSYSFRIFGNMNGTAVDETFVCGPTTFECVDPASEVQFPQQIPAGHDLQVGLANLQSQVAQLQSGIGTAYAIAGGGVVVGIVGIAVGAMALRKSKKRR
jgi:X-X-X-Leu-X-X-Gly heptad repeat protein